MRLFKEFWEGIFNQCKGQANSEPKPEYLKIVYNWLIKNFPEESYKNLEYIGPYHKAAKQRSLRENALFKFNNTLKVFRTKF